MHETLIEHLTGMHKTAVNLCKVTALQIRLDAIEHEKHLRDYLGVPMPLSELADWHDRLIALREQAKLLTNR